MKILLVRVSSLGDVLHNLPMVADLLRYTIASVLTFATGFAMGYRPGGGVPGVLAALLLTIVTGWSLAWIFTFVGIIGKSAQAVQGMSMMIMFPLTFLSNAFVPADTLPEWLQTFVNINPVSHVVTAVRDLANDGAVTAQVGWALFACAAVIAIFAPLGVLSKSSTTCTPTARSDAAGTAATLEASTSICGGSVPSRSTTRVPSASRVSPWTSECRE